MNQIYVFLIRNDVWIYIVSALGLIWYLGQLVRARRELRQAMFGLERERALQRQRRALSLSAILFGIIIIVTYVNLSIAPDLPEQLLKPPTPTPNIFVTPLSSPTPIGTDDSATVALAATVTLAASSEDEGGSNSEPSPEPTIPPTPPTHIGECPAEISISSPPDGTQISGDLTIFGTASGGEADSYDIEAHGEYTAYEWLSLLEDRMPTPVLDGILGSIDLSSWTSGLYTIRLVVFNIEDDITGQCAIQISLSQSN